MDAGVGLASVDVFKDGRRTTVSTWLLHETGKLMLMRGSA